MVKVIVRQTGGEVISTTSQKDRTSLLHEIARTHEKDRLLLIGDYIVPMSTVYSIELKDVTSGQ